MLQRKRKRTAEGSCPEPDEILDSPQHKRARLRFTLGAVSEVLGSLIDKAQTLWTGSARLSLQLQRAARQLWLHLPYSAASAYGLTTALQQLPAELQKKASPCTPPRQLRPVFEVSAFVTASSVQPEKAADSCSRAALTAHQRGGSSDDVQQFTAEHCREAPSAGPRQDLLPPSDSTLRQRPWQPGSTAEQPFTPDLQARAQADAAHPGVAQPAETATQDASRSACSQPADQAISSADIPAAAAAVGAAPAHLHGREHAGIPVQPASAANSVRPMDDGLDALASLATHILHSPPKTRDRILHYGLACVSGQFVGSGMADALQEPPAEDGADPDCDMLAATEQPSGVHSASEAAVAAAVTTPAQPAARRKVHFPPVEVTGVALVPQWALAHQQALERQAPYGPRQSLSPCRRPRPAMLPTPSPTRSPSLRPASFMPNPFASWKAHTSERSAPAAQSAGTQSPSGSCMPGAAAVPQRRAGAPVQQPVAQAGGMPAAGPMAPAAAAAGASAAAPSAMPDFPRRLVYERQREARSPDTIAWRVPNTPQQVFREAYLSAKLGRAWEDGQAWAETDMNGVQMSRELCSLKQIQYANAASHLLRTQGKRLTKHFRNLMENEWQQLKALCMQACNQQGSAAGVSGILRHRMVQPSTARVLSSAALTLTSATASLPAAVQG